MDKMIFETISAAFRMILRHWIKRGGDFEANIMDIENLVQQFGLTLLEARRFDRTINSFIDKWVEEFIGEFGSKIENNNRREEIINQLLKDIESVNIDERKLILEMPKTENLYNLIIKQSEKERQLWSVDEISIYTNCARYISKVATEFVIKLPNFSSEALKVVVQRQEEFSYYLHKILQNIHTMTNLIRNTEDEKYQEYERIYRNSIIEKYSKVELIGSGINNARSITRYDLSSAYVELSCTNKSEYKEEIALSQVFADNNIVWIKGEAGTGKTTFLQWVAVCAAKNDYIKIDNIKDVIPIVIILRNAQIINLEDAVNRITEEYGNKCPNGWISNLLKKNRVILLFDGIDETNQIIRKEVYDFIERTSKRYPQIKMLLTARNSVRDHLNCHTVEYEIMPMKIKNIKKFITYWHISVLRKDAIVADQEIDRIQFNLKKKIVDTPSLKVLAKNPLLCAMICALNYLNNEQLPEEKIELYEKCCEMLIEERDKQRKISQDNYRNLPTLNYRNKRRILEEIAYWMMNSNVSSANKRLVIQFLKNLLENTTILLDDKVEYDAEDLLNYLIDRSGIIREPEDGVIDFIHKTFMEFLTVNPLCRNCAWYILIREACNTNWKETIIMCFQEMGQNNIEYVLGELVKKSKIEGDGRYALIAALGASNALLFSNSQIKKEIDLIIKEMIPPKQRDITEISQAGLYLLPFLNNSIKYSDAERKCCLDLLARIGMGDIIPVVLSYIESNGNISIKIYALNLLSEFDNVLLEEYNIKEQLLKILLDSINGDSLTICKCMTDIIGSIELKDKDIKKMEKVKSLYLICEETEESKYIWETEIFKYFNVCKEVVLSGIIPDAYFLSQFTHLNKLMIKAKGDISEVVHNLQNMKNLRSINSLYIEAEQLHYIHEQDLSNMKVIEILELHCLDKQLHFDINNFDFLPKLKKVILEVNDFVAVDIGPRIPIWKGKNCDLEIVINKKI